MHVYRVQARLIKWKHEMNDCDYHLVLTDDTLNYADENANPPVPPTGHSFVREVPARLAKSLNFQKRVN